MIQRTLVRAGLATGFVLLALVVIVVAWAFVDNIDRHIGSDYTAFASNIVRGQHETAMLRHSTDAFLEQPSEFHQAHILRTLSTIQARQRTTRTGMLHQGMDKDEHSYLLEEFDLVLDRIPRLEELTEAALEDPHRRDEFRQVAMEVEDDLAFVYSEIHEVNQTAAADQQRLMRWLSWAVAALTLLTLTVIAALLWTVDTIIGQKARLQRLSVTDVLTGLPNRRALLQQVEQALAQSRRNGRPVSIALLDIDHFKTINDLDGHPAGDRVLRLLAERLLSMTRETDLLARIGGEEFGLLMPDTDLPGARDLCERIRQSVSELQLPVSGDKRGLTVSIGLTTGHADQNPSFNALYIKADRALYAAKEQGRNRVIIQD